MAQVSANTLTYDQIYLKIRDFYIKEVSNQFVTNQDRIEQYKQLLTDIYNSLGGPMVKFDPFIKGEPPFSEKFNNFSNQFVRDLAVVSKQIDYLNAKVINAFNLFSIEVDTEKKYIERIASKAKVLQMYSKAPAEDLIYIGDSFENSDQIDIGKIPIGLNPNIENGSFTLPISRSRPWIPRSVSIDTLYSNGFLGNNHQVVKSTSSEQQTDYKYVYSNNRNLSLLNVVMDNNPLTYFEYEGLNVDKSSNSEADLNLLSEKEFSYINNSSSSSAVQGVLSNWSNYNIEDPLRLKIAMENTSSNVANCITITPYFGSMKIVKIVSIKATKSNGEVLEILDSPIYIGSSFSSLNLDISKNYFYNKATIRFSEIRVSKFEIFFEQDFFENIDVQHAFWKPAYSNNSQQDSPFYNLSRFNPDALSSDLYDSIEYDRNSLIPKLSLPNEFKDLTTAARVVDVRMTRKPIVYSGYGIVLKLTPAMLDSATPSTINGDPNVVTRPNAEVKTAYYYNWVSGETEEESYFSYVDQVSELFLPNDARVELIGNPSVYDSSEAAAAEYDRLQQYLESINNILYVSELYEYYIVEEATISEITYTAPARNLSYRVPITLDYELYDAKRKAIGIRDISATYETYANKAEVVSTPYKFDTPIETLMLSVDSTIDNLFSNKIQANYYISVNNSEWIQISPVQLFSNGIAEVLVFNKNVPSNYQIPGIAYINYPAIEKEIKEVRVKIELSKDRLTNVTPSIFSYQLMVRIQR